MKYNAGACHFNMDTGCVELLLRDGRMISIDCTGVEDALDVTMAPKRGESRIRTGAQGVADPCLTTWLSRHKNILKKQIGLRQASMS